MVTLEDKKRFASMFIEPEHWLVKASACFSCARQTRTMYEASCHRALANGGFHLGQSIGPVYLMLCGNGLEALLKALIVHREGSRLLENGILTKRSGARIFTHDLTKLAEMVGDPVTDSEHHMLASLSEFIIWAGRYPFPKDAESMLASAKTTGVPGKWPWDWSGMSSRHKDLTDLISKLCAQFPSKWNVQARLALF